MEAIEKEELFDEELRGLVKFTDETANHTEPVKEEKKPASKEHAKRKKVVQKPISEPVDAEYEPAKTWYDEKAIECAKWFLIFAGLEYLVFYWMQTGQMTESAAMPSMLVCALLAGLSVGKYWNWRA